MHWLSIIYCYRNRDIPRVKNSLESLKMQTEKGFDVIFIDYGSDDDYKGEIEALCKQYSFCKYIFIDSHGKLWNRADALNYGILNSKTEYVFTSDVDLIFKCSFISTLREKRQKGIAKFFSVGYLSDSNSKQINLNSIDKLSFNKSEDFALGMVLIRKEEFKK